MTDSSSARDGSRRQVGGARRAVASSTLSRVSAGAWTRLRAAGLALLDCSFPRICPLCENASDRPGRLVCWECFRRLPLHTADDPICRRCGLAPQGSMAGDFLCDLCRRAAPAFDGARAAAAFRGGLRGLLHAFKYQRATWLRADLVDLLQGCVTAYYDTADIDLVVPVPLHPRKQRQRTYNQSALLADALARRLGLEARGDSLRRARATPSQTRLSAAARRANVRGAFEVARPAWVRGRSVLLVDDVMTTGATLHEAAACLKRAGAWRVWAVAVARG